MSESRICQRTTCRWPAAASLSFRYASRQVWVSDVTETTDPSRYDLCRFHADSLTVPRGWERIDERTGSEATPPPIPAPAPQATAPVAHSEPSPRTNRYAALLADLPRVAAAHRAREVQRKAARTASRSDGTDDEPWRSWTRELLGGDAIPQVEGQLSMPVDEHGIVVPIELAEVRRRIVRTPAG